MATAETAFGGGLNSSSGGELKLYLKWKETHPQMTVSINQRHKRNHNKAYYMYLVRPQLEQSRMY